MRSFQLHVVYVRLSLLVFIQIMNVTGLFAQCVNPSTPINFNVSGNNTSTGYTTAYVLTDDDGKILIPAVSSGFPAPGINGSYYLYAVNYRKSETAPVVTRGANIASIGGTCVSVSAAPAQFCVAQGCVQTGSSVAFSISGNNTEADYATTYILTDNDGSIISTHSGSPITAPSAVGTYKIYAANYRNAAGNTAPVLTAGTNITEIGGSCSAISSVPVTFCASAPLPVTLISFSVEKSEQSTKLLWATTSETNSDRFDIERSRDGKTWNKIGTVLSHTESKQLMAYDFEDKKPLMAENLYRLKMVDLDGTFAYSRIQSIRFDGKEADLSIYPNPSAGRFNIRDHNTVKSVTITDLNGHMLYHSESVAAGNGSIDVKSLSQGVYIVQVTRRDGTLYTQKVVVNK